MTDHLREFICTLTGPDADFGGLAAVRLAGGKLWFSVDLPWEPRVDAAAIVAADRGRPLRIVLVDRAHDGTAEGLFGSVEGDELQDFGLGASNGRSYDLEVVSGPHRLRGRLREVGVKSV